MRDKLLNECSLVEEYTTYNAETHHGIAAKRKTMGNVLNLGPPVITAILGALTATGELPLYGAWLTAMSAIFSAFATGLNPFADADAHLRAGKAWTLLKHDARALRDTFSNGMTDDAFAASVKALHDRYNDLVLQSPPTTDKEFMEARKKIKADIHASDNPALRRPVATPPSDPG